MSSTTIVVLAVLAVVVLGALFVFTTSARRDRAAAVTRAGAGAGNEASGASGRDVEKGAELERRAGGAELAPASGPSAPVLRPPMDPEVLAVTRRQFLNRGIVNFFGLGLAGFGAASLGFLWPTLSGGFGSKVKAGKLDDIVEQIHSSREPFYVPAARSWVSLYPKEALSKAENIYTGAVLEGMKEGVVALYQKCVHLGCRVPWCKASQWFECPCHGSQYNRVGEQKAGPAPRGLDRFGVAVEGGQVMIDTKEVIQGPPIGTNTTGQEAEGPHCA